VSSLTADLPWASATSSSTDESIARTNVNIETASNPALLTPSLFTRGLPVLVAGPP
jgi:hypothetical protein